MVELALGLGEPGGPGVDLGAGVGAAGVGFFVRERDQLPEVGYLGRQHEVTPACDERWARLGAFADQRLRFSNRLRGSGGLTVSYPESTPEPQIVSELQAGNGRLFGCVVERYHRAMVVTVGRFTSNRALGDEIVQDTWIAVMKGIGGFDGRSSLRRWIFAILANRARSIAGREARTLPMSALAGGDDPAAAVDLIDAARFDGKGMWSVPPRSWRLDTPEAFVSNGELVELIQQAIEDLPLRQAAVLSLRDIERLDAHEVCELLDISEGNQRVLLHRARAAIRTALEAQLGDPL